MPPPPYDTNPDRRPLPTDWITQYDPNYGAWYYVNTVTGVTTWIHPSGPAPYPPPAGPPNNSSTYAGGYDPATAQGSYSSQGGGNGHPQPFGGYGDSRGAEYEQDNPQRNVDNNSKGLGFLGRLTGGHHHHHDGRFGNEGRFGGGGGGYTGGGGYPGQQPQARKGFGVGTLALGAGAGLLGGVLLEDLIEDRIDNSYDAGFDAGAGFDGGDNFYGGDDFDGGLF